MNVSGDIENLHDYNKSRKNLSKEDLSSMFDLSEILDLSSLNLDNEETWLYESQNISNVNVQDWLYGKCDIPFNLELPPDFIVPKLKSSKSIDTRTFTRPKKKFIRPSINDYQQLYLSGSDGTDLNSSSEMPSSPRRPQTVKEEQEGAGSAFSQPLQFDLSQPTSLHNFDSFMMNSADVDSFQNMSPPSLVNSLCSSTFANLMESSFIKNDPVLREIRDKDFTETALLQDIEAPMFQSITESCSSLNSDSPESFLKKVSYNGTFRRNMSDSNTTITQERSSDGSTGNSIGNNATFEVQNLSAGSKKDNKHTTFPINTTPQPQSIEDTHATKSNQSSLGSHNGTYRRAAKPNGTFRKSDLKNNRLSLNLSYEMSMSNDINVLDRDVSKSIENDMNNSNKGSTDSTKSSTRTVILRSDSIENLKKRFSASDLNMDLNRLSYCLEKQDNQVNATYKDEKPGTDLNRTVEIKRSSLGSADSLDRMSSLSSSSKGSNKVLSMEDVEAIVEMQERSLSQVMSTPKPHRGPKKLWDNNFISPIVADSKDRLSDSELSDDYKSVKSQMSSKVSLETWKKPSTKSLGYLAASNNDIKLKTTQKGTAGQRPLQALPNKMRGSYSNINTLKTTSTTIGGSHSNLFRPSSNMIRPPSISNLKSMGTRLKGSYTSLKPISANLPVVPPIGASINTTQTITRRNLVNVTRVTGETTKMEVPPVPKERVVPAPAESTFVKPQNLRTSGLPRPTGIPRPASRIPGPRSTNIRNRKDDRRLSALTHTAVRADSAPLVMVLDEMAPSVLMQHPC